MFTRTHILLLGLVIVLVAVGGTFFWYQRQKIVTTETNEAVIGEVTKEGDSNEWPASNAESVAPAGWPADSSASLQELEAAKAVDGVAPASWLIYTSTRYVFSLRYPDEMEIIEEDNAILVQDKDDKDRHYQDILIGRELSEDDQTLLFDGWAKVSEYIDSEINSGNDYTKEIQIVGTYKPFVLTPKTAEVSDRRLFFLAKPFLVSVTYESVADAQILKNTEAIVATLRFSPE